MQRDRLRAARPGKLLGFGEQAPPQTGAAGVGVYHDRFEMGAGGVAHELVAHGDDDQTKHLVTGCGHVRETVVATSCQHVVKDDDIAGPQVVGVATLGYVEVRKLGKQCANLCCISFDGGSNFGCVAHCGRIAAMQKFSSTTATTIVIANMVGTGVFTSLGFQLLDIQAAPVILMLWVLGGVLALCGALCYAELGAALPRSGGEYNYVARVYHPGAGFISGWISATIGFAAPTALAAITAGAYLQVLWPEVSRSLAAAVLVLVVTAVHMGSRGGSSRFQLLFTAAKIALIVVFVATAFWHVETVQPVRWLPVMSDLDLVGTAGFAIALIFVNYAYTGWNAATYLAGEVHDVTRSLPRILIVGTAVVTALYVVLHVMFLSVAPMDAMAGQLEIGYIVADFAFGDGGSRLIAGMLAVLLISTVSAMILAGPRALQVIGEDVPALGVLARTNRHGVPYVAIGTQTALTLVMILTSTFEAILIFASFTLALNTLVTVAGVAVLRHRQPELARPFEVPWYPVPVLIYCGITFWTLVYVLWERPVEAAVGAALIAAGWLFYRLTRATVAPHLNSGEEQ